jgi:hypothetical protein
LKQRENRYPNIGKKITNNSKRNLYYKTNIIQESYCLTEEESFSGKQRENGEKTQ